MVSLASKLLLTGKATFSRLLRQIPQRFEQLIPSNDSAEYRLWRNDFMWKRLGFCLRGAIPLWLCGTANDLYYWFHILQVRGEFSPQMKQIGVKWLSVSLIHNAFIAPILVTLLIVHKTKWGHRFPGVIFLFLSCCCTLLLEVLATFSGFAMGNTDLWRLVFLIQATLIPVRWQLHCISHLSVVGYYIVVNSALGWEPIEGHRLVSLGSFLMIFCFCSICNLAVYMYDRLQRSEFESRRELRVFLHAISHDLRTPLMGNAIVFQNLLKKSDSQVTISSKALERLLEGNSRQINLINSLREAYTLEVRGVKLNSEPLRLSRVLNSVLSDLEPLIIEHSVIVKNLVNDNLPLVNADAIQLGRVLSNLITNAFKHNPDEITLTIDAFAQNKKILCQVQDNGVGISKKQCKRIFELYTRGENARFMPGLGLGLYVCKQIITAHSGKIGVQSQLGRGSTFWFTLPIIGRVRSKK